MSLSQCSSTPQNESMNATLDPRLLDLLRHLRTLPPSLSDHPNIYPFTSFVLDPYDAEHYGSIQGALNHRLELVFGSRNGDRLIEFKGRGSSLEAIVYIFYKYIDGESGENELLWKWVRDLTHAAKEIAKNGTSPPKPGATRPRALRGGKQQGRTARTGSNARPKPSEARITAAKATSAIRYPHDPADLEDETLHLDAGCGRLRNEFLDKLLIPCHSIIDPSHLRVRCRGAGCGWSWAEPRATVRVLRHARDCMGLEEDLRNEAKRRSGGLSLASKLQSTPQDSTPDSTPTSPETQPHKNSRANHALLKWLCDRMIPPSAVDSPRWRDLVSVLDPSTSTASGTTITDNFVTTEAAFVHQESVNQLSEGKHLTLSYDGGTTRKHESVYTVHVTDPSTRSAHLMEGNEASGVSHTAEHICSILDKTLKEIGPEHFASIVSDNAGNTRAARVLIEKEYPWIIALQDACQQRNNAAKDVGELEYFQPCITKMKSIITHFHTSSYAARHLAALRVTYHVNEGLVAIGNTRFASYYYASRSTLRCLPLIFELLSSGVLYPKPASPIYWMLDRTEVQAFKEELTQLAAVLEPFARSIKCLESSHSTLSDVYLFWLAILARFREIADNNQSLSGVGLPSLVIEDIHSILNGRHAEMFQTQSGQVYSAAFFLDIRYRNSDILLRHPSRLLAETWRNQHFTSSAEVLPDQDLRQSLPAYTIAGDYLVKLLGQTYNKDPDAPLFTRYTTWAQIETAFRNQLVLYTRGLSPFHRMPKPLTEHTYWESLCSVPTAELLAHPGVVLTSIVPNSMAEERTMSTLTKLNSPDRAAQKVSTLIDMATIRQYYKREENLINLSTCTLRPTLRFADLSQILGSAAQINTPGVAVEFDQEGIDDTSEPQEIEPTGDAVLDEERRLKSVSRGNRHQFEVELTDGISLSSKLLTDMISDNPGNTTRSTHPAELSIAESAPPRKRQRVDVSTLAY